MQIQYLCPYWGSENDTADLFLRKALSAGYSGAEIFFPETGSAFTKLFLATLEEMRRIENDVVFIALQLTSPENDSVDNYIKRMEKNFMELAAFQPAFINSHTGKDHFSFDDNCRVIEAAMNISVKTGVRILHETHRGRFSFHSTTLLPYLKKFPEIELVADFSHFCTVSESMLQDQQEIIQQIIPHVSHIHARIGYEQSPQVNDPAAPEWQDHFDRFAAWWQGIINYKASLGWKKFTITPEHGPFPYMPQAPYSKLPLSNQWENNVYMMNRLKTIIE